MFATTSPRSSLPGLRPVTNAAFPASLLDDDEREPARIQCETLALIGWAALALDASGRVLAANDLVEPMNDVFEETRDRLWFRDSQADGRFRRALASLEVGGTATSFAIRRGGTRVAAHFVSCRGLARSRPARCAALLVLRPVVMATAPDLDLMQSLFEFTAKEAAVAQDIAEGRTVAEIARRRGVSQATVRAQLNGAFAKTGCRRQAEMVALLAGLSPARVARR